MPLLHPTRGSLSNRTSVLIGVLTALAITAFLITLLLVLYQKGKQKPVPPTIAPREDALEGQPTLPPAYTYLQSSSAPALSKAYRAPSQCMTKGSVHDDPAVSTSPGGPSISSHTSKSRLWSPSGSLVAHGPTWKQAPPPPRTQESLATLPSAWSSSTLAAPGTSAQKLSQDHGALIRGQTSGSFATSESSNTTLVRPQIQGPLCQSPHINSLTSSQNQSTEIPCLPAVSTSATGHSCPDPTCSLHSTRPRSLSLPARIDAPCSLKHSPLPSSTSTLMTVGESTIVEQQEWRVTTSTTDKEAEKGDGEGEASVDSFVAVMLQRCSKSRVGNQSIDGDADRGEQGYKDGIVDANERLAAVFEALGLAKVDVTGSRRLEAVQASA
ncbi:hypothetical protein BCV69DRAFT_284225 [Microstroma glucosiphilum]|uniref:Uncharacterized protein n=1 Tax=Pseudomicrostroma glucosiphilum TaxID=1684307 RepID=A0A316U495_9BASI|nr:hypothetical protein BCV69DRAFT_284225 [Pseudomicrostroma glucosiphilum]PWN19594.1 hypothetical protein BCV69DRAFT_284225 [Pseudomicrostroma glucosiphilum]